MRAHSSQSDALAGCAIVITRPAGTGASLARRIRALGAIPVMLPGLSLRPALDPVLAREQWRKAQHDDVLVFTSPAAVRYALALHACHTRATVIATGQGTASALRRHGIQAQVPSLRQDSEGILALSSLQPLQGRRVALVTAPEGRGLLQQQLAERGASLREVHVYRRGPPRLDRRHVQTVSALPERTCVLLSSAQAMKNLMERLPATAWRRLCRADAIASSERIAALADEMGFSRRRVAASAGPDDLLAAACESLSNDPAD
ncbi:uroporphyrinogen-III synthase [Dyella jejuensis]|uniref:uroporphyrinogen-III synthase n=1 Tax=Dyella jejuensis TaxID=1432009 RepID=UPI00384F490E